MMKIRPSAPARADTGVGLTAGQNEFASFQVVVQGGDAGMKNVRATLSALNDAGGHSVSGADLTLYREDYLHTDRSTFPDLSAGAWPDALIPDTDELAQEHRRAFPFDVAPNEARAIWADVHVPPTLPPGIYRGAVTVSADGLSRQVHVTLTVLGLALPSTPSLTTAFMLFPGNVCTAHTGDSECHGDAAVREALLKRYVAMGLEHRFTLPNLFSYPRDGNWGAYDSTWGGFLDGTAPSRLPGAQMTSVQFTGPRDFDSYAAFAGHLKSRGWFGRAFDYTGDEPPLGLSYGEVSQRAALVHQAAPGLPTLVTTTLNNARDHGILGDVDILVPVMNYLNGTEAPYVGDQRDGYGSFLAQGGHKLWTYQSCMSQGCADGSVMRENSDTAGWPTYAVDVAAGRNRAMEWVSFLERVQGELYYQTAGTLPEAWNSQRNYNGNGDGNLFYPGTPSAIGGSSDVPVASIRMKMIRMGVQDYEWLKRVRESGDPAFADAVARAVVPASWKATDDGAAYDRARLQLAARYLELSHQDAAFPVQGAPPVHSATEPTAGVQAGADPVTTPGAAVPAAASSVGSGTAALPTAKASTTLGRPVLGNAAAHGGCSATSATAFAWPLGLVLGALALLRSRREQAPVRARAGR